MTLQPRHIRAGRALIDATQHDMAKAAKLSLATLNNIERGIAHPREKTFERIRLALTDAGVKIEANADLEQVSLEPHGYLKEEPGMRIRDTLSRLIHPNSLLQVQCATFFSFKKDYHRCGLYLEGRHRRILYVDPGLDMRHRIGLAELAAVVINARKELRDKLSFVGVILPAIPEDSSQEPFKIMSSLLQQADFSHFLLLFPESQSSIETARNAPEHPLSHVLQIFQDS